MRVTLHNRVFESYIPESTLQKAIRKVAARINLDYASSQKPPILLVTLNGAFLFGAELYKELTPGFELGFVKLASYGSGTKSSGKVRVEIAPTVPIRGRDVIVVEDVVETGNTIETLYKLLTEAGAKSIRTATLLIKPNLYLKSIPIDYMALEIEDRFVVGFGLDYNQQGRNLRDIYQLVVEE